MPIPRPTQPPFMSALRALWRHRRERPVFVALVAVLLGVLFLTPFVDWYLRTLIGQGVAGLDWVQEFHFRDFGAYATAVARWEGGENIYWISTYGDYFGTYIYPPPYLLLFIPAIELGEAGLAAFLPWAGNEFEAAVVLWNGVSIAILWAGLVLLAKELGLDLAWFEIGGLVWVVVGFYPLLFSLKLGQASAFVAGVLVFAYVAMERGAAGRETGAGTGQEDGGSGEGAAAGSDGGGIRATLTKPGWPAAVASGAVTAVVGLLKLYYATTGAHLLRNGRRFLGAVLGGLALLGLSLGVFRVENTVAYVDVLTWGKGWTEVPAAIYLWHPGYFQPFYDLAQLRPEAAIVLRLLLIALVIGVVLLARNEPARRETFVLGVALYPLAAPVAYTQDFVALLLVAAVLVAIEFERNGYPWLPVFAVLLLHAHAHGLLGMVKLAEGMDGRLLLELAPVLQPGVWGVGILFVLSIVRVLDRTEWWDRVFA